MKTSSGNFLIKILARDSSPEMNKNYKRKNKLVKNSVHPKYLYWAIPIIFYALLFEFILPLNKILPGPSLIIESISALFKTYRFIFNLFYSASGVYVSMIAAYFIIYFTAGSTIAFFDKFRNTIKTFSALKYFPLIGILLIFLFWFPTSNVSEYLFSISFSLIFLYRIIFLGLKNVKKEYITSARSIGLTSSEIYSSIYWKSIQPYIFENLITLHFALWNVILIFELLKGDLGIGSIYKTAFQYKDISVMFTLSLFMMLVLFTGKFVIKFLKAKIIYWEN